MVDLEDQRLDSSALRGSHDSMTQCNQSESGGTFKYQFPSTIRPQNVTQKLKGEAKQLIKLNCKVYLKCTRGQYNENKGIWKISFNLLNQEGFLIK